MAATTHLSNVIVGHFSKAEAGAFANFVTVTDGLSGEQAAAVPAERFNSVSYHTAEITGIRHMLQLWVDHPFV